MNNWLPRKGGAWRAQPPRYRTPRKEKAPAAVKLRPSVRSFADNAARATEDCILDAATARKPKFEVEPTLPSQCS